LRLHDNEALLDALRTSEEVVPVYVFDERVFQGQTKYGYPKTGRHRAKFIIESIADLRKGLKAIGSNLIVRIGKPEEILFELAQEVKSTWVFCNRERTKEEVEVQDKLEKKLWEIGQEVRYSRGKMLYYTADLPFPVTHTPDIFTHFRKEVEKYIQIREPLAAPVKGDFQPLSIRIEEGEIPALSDFGHPEIAVDERTVLTFKGGETAALERLQHYLWETDAIKNYKETRNGLIGEDYSQDKNWADNEQLLHVWVEGRTGIPFIDANMRELALTGFMSNRGRQNVASFLVKDLQVNWQMGADYFESMLIDYDPCSNWGNWNYVAGVGSDPREDRYFNILKQAKRYDNHGDYVKIWCPELKGIPSDKIHQPDTLSEKEQSQFNCKLGVDYPKAMIRTDKWL